MNKLRVASFLFLILTVTLPLQAVGDHFNALANTLGWSKDKQLLISRFADDVLKPFETNTSINLDEAISMGVLGTKNSLWHTINQQEDGTLRTHSPLSELYLAELLTAPLDEATAKYVKDLFDRLMGDQKAYDDFGKTLKKLASLEFVSTQMRQIKIKSLHNEDLIIEIPEEQAALGEKELKKLHDDPEATKIMQSQDNEIVKVAKIEAYIFKKVYKDGPQVVEKLQRESNTFYNLKYNTDRDSVIASYFKLHGQYSYYYVNLYKNFLIPKRAGVRNVETYPWFNNTARWGFMFAGMFGTQFALWVNAAKIGFSKHIEVNHTMRGAFTAGWNKMLDEGVKQFNPFHWQRTIKEGYTKSGWRGGALQGLNAMMVPLSLGIGYYFANWAYRIGSYGKAETVMKQRLGVFKDLYTVYGTAEELVDGDTQFAATTVHRIDEALQSSFVTREGKAAGLYAELMSEGEKTSDMLRKVAIADAVYALADFAREHDATKDTKQPVCMVTPSTDGSFMLKSAWPGVGIRDLVLNDIDFNKAPCYTVFAPPSSGKTVLEKSVYHSCILNNLCGIALAKEATMPKLAAVRSFLAVDEDTGISSGAGHTQGVKALTEYTSKLDPKEKYMLLLDEPMSRVPEKMAKTTVGRLFNVVETIQEKNKQSLDGKSIHLLCISHFDLIKNVPLEINSKGKKKYPSFKPLRLNFKLDVDNVDKKKWFTPLFTATYGKRLSWNYSDPLHAKKYEDDTESYNLAKEVSDKFDEWYDEFGSLSKQ